VKRRPQARVRNGRTVGQIPGFKKAYVTLAAGEKIEFFEGV
jgi:large subunit ribosomal protein L23